MSFGRLGGPGVNDNTPADNGVYTCRDLAQLANADVHGRLRVIGHCDLDCAFAQFEAKRMGWDVTVEPVAVEQWGSLLAVSYTARAAGVSRMMNLAAARAVCPGLKATHVSTYAPGARHPAYHPHPDPTTHKVSLDQYRRIGRTVADAFRALSGAEIQRAGTDEAYFDLCKPVHTRLCVLFPELASLNSESPDQLLPPPPQTLDWSDRGAIIFPPEPEASSDATPDHARTSTSEPGALPSGPSAIATDPDSDAGRIMISEGDASLAGREKLASNSDTKGGPDTKAETDGPEPPLISSRGSGTQGQVTWGDVVLWVGAGIMAEVRRGVRSNPDLGYTTSAGISRNKTLAKLGSSHRKPNGQTVVLGGAMRDFIGSHAVLKVPSLKGKLGQALCDEFGVDRVSELRRYTLEQLMRISRVDGPMDAPWLYNLVRGNEYVSIVTEPASRSMLASKSLRPPIRIYNDRTPQLIQTWRYTLASELCVRLTEARLDQNAPTLTPSSMVMRAAVRVAGSATATYRSHQVPIAIAPGLDELQPEPLLPATQRLWEHLAKDLPAQSFNPDLTHITLSFAGLHAPSAGQKSLQSFFSAPSASALSASTTQPQATSSYKSHGLALPALGSADLVQNDNFSPAATSASIIPAAPPSPPKLDRDFFSNSSASASDDEPDTKRGRWEDEAPLVPEPQTVLGPSSTAPRLQDPCNKLSWTCPDCGTVLSQDGVGSSSAAELVAASLLAQDRQMHQDFHLAQRLQAQDTVTDRASNSAGPSVRPDPVNSTAARTQGTKRSHSRQPRGPTLQTFFRKS